MFSQYLKEISPLRLSAPVEMTGGMLIPIFCHNKVLSERF